MLVMLTIITLSLTPKVSATTLCVQNVSSFTIGLRDEIAGVLLEGTNTTDTYEFDCTVGESKLYYY